MLALVGRDEPVVKRTAEQIRADKERLEEALRKKPQPNPKMKAEDGKVPV